MRLQISIYVQCTYSANALILFITKNVTSFWVLMNCFLFSHTRIFIKANILNIDTWMGWDHRFFREWPTCVLRWGQMRVSLERKFWSNFLCHEIPLIFLWFINEVAHQSKVFGAKLIKAVILKWFTAKVSWDCPLAKKQTFVCKMRRKSFFKSVKI